MKYRVFPILLLAILFSFQTSFAQSTAEKFNEWMPKMASDNRDEKENSQQSWQKICMMSGAPGQEALKAEVNKLMLEQLDKDIPVDTKVWLLYQLRFTGEKTVVPGVAACLKDVQTRIRDEAARALSQNSSPEALKALEEALAKSDNDFEKGRIKNAIAARKLDLKVGVETKMPQAIPYVPAGEVDKWMAGYDKLEKAEKLKTLASLKVRKDKKYLPVVISAIKGDDNDLKVAGILALQTLGGTKEIPLLVDNRFNDNWPIAMRTIRMIVDEGFDDALLAILKNETDNNRFFGLAEDLGERNHVKALPVILAFAKSDKCDKRADLLKVAEKIATQADLKDFVEIALKIDDRRQRDEAEKVIARLCNNSAKPIIALMNKDNSGELLTLLGRVGGDDALEAVRGALKTDAKEAAMRALCNWPNAKVYEDLIGFVKNADTPEPMKIAALRGAIRVITLPDDQIGITIDTKKRLESLKNALELSKRNQEKLLVIERAAAVRAPETVEFVLPFVDQADFSERACLTIADIAHHNEVRKANKELFIKALDKVLETTKDNGLKDRVRKYRDTL